MTRISEQVEWLNLVDRSGPLLAPKVLEEVFPQGLEKIETPRRQRIRAAYDEWRDAVDLEDPDLGQLHEAWTLLVIREALEYEDGILISGKLAGEVAEYRSIEYGANIVPDHVVVGPDEKSRLLVSIYPPRTDLERSVPGDRWPATPIERMTMLCRENGVRIGLITNGEAWVLVNAPIGSTSGFASWLARLWWQEPVTLKAFISLLGVRRCFGPPNEALDQLLERSLEFQEDVTVTLGEQVRRAVEVLIQALVRADQDRNGELLKDVSPSELYEAGLTVMMRLVFILCAEERGLFLLGDPIYDQYYAISTIRAMLREEESHLGSEVLERRHDAWSRMLTMFRTVYGGIEHEMLRIPALGGSLFDPDRFPFLEGRAKETYWREEPARPLPIDNRTVLLLLKALQVLEQRGGAQLLSYRALDIEQIGHVYEGLLEYTVIKFPEITIGLIGTKKKPNPSISLEKLEELHEQNIREVVDFIVDSTGRSTSAIENALDAEIENDVRIDLVQACSGDEELVDRILPFAELIRADNWGNLLIYPAGSFAVSPGANRRETGTHYTPRSLTEAIVETALEPIVYEGPMEGKPREDWKLKIPVELLDLKICDPAMGSGAFLVQVCRYLAEHLVHAWAREEEKGRVIAIDGKVHLDLEIDAQIPRDIDERLIIARRLIAERCLYGVDVNPLAVELAKLSTWLVTLAKGRPFGFLDHNLRHGDSLLGILRLDQLRNLEINSTDGIRQERLFGRTIDTAAEKATKLRSQIRQTQIRDIRDVELMKRVEKKSSGAIEVPMLIADAFIGEVLHANGDLDDLAAAMISLALDADRFQIGDENSEDNLRDRVFTSLSKGHANGLSTRKPFHWPLEFPEVFSDPDGGFDCIVGNPPFLGGKRISTVFGPKYNSYLSVIHTPASKNTDLCAHFYRRSFNLIKKGGIIGLLAVNTIAEGETRQGGLEWIMKNSGVIFTAYPDEPWPGKASVVTSRVHIYKGLWQGIKLLSGAKVPLISAYLSGHHEWTPFTVKASTGKSFQGSILLGMGFTISKDQADEMIASNPRNREVVFQYLNGEDLNSDPGQAPSRWVINFWDWPEDKARDYCEPFEWIKDHVFPERLEKSKLKSYENILSHWWLHERPRPAMYHAIGRGHNYLSHPGWWKPETKPMPKVLAISGNSKTGAFALIENNSIFSNTLVIFSLHSYYDFAILQSSIHLAWAWKQSSKLKEDMRYTPTDVFETFVFPNEIFKERLTELGEDLHNQRQGFMQERQIGLTDFYSQFHDPSTEDPRFNSLRTLQSEIDELVAASYGWEDFKLDHDFHVVGYLPNGKNLRYSISEIARVEILRRMLQINKEHAIQEDI